ncbi:MAG TPA: hypothetical protein VFE19_12995 [Jatrophihabitantaceae bacterium]|nr:hypothetical protein [Jatrophihabitantaceae bacterium]
MRDTTADTAAAAKTKSTGRVSMTKNAAPSRPVRAGRPVRAPVANIKAPRTIDYASAAIVLMVAANAAYALLLHFAGAAQLTAYAIKANQKKPVKNFDAAKTVSTFRSSAILSAVIIGLALLLLVWALRRTRSASASRWAMLIVFVFTGLPLQVIPTAGLPSGPQAAAVVVGVAAIATLLLVFIPKPSLAYFKACREANIPEELRGQPRPGLGSLFGPKRPRGAAAATKTAPAARPSAPERPASAPKSKAKVRSDSDAIAKGAELARSRAKASKSRRTTD